MPYIRPKQVVSPKKNWALVEVLVDGGEGGCSYAIGMWDGEPRIAMRWNGTDDAPLGNPQSRGLPTWTMLDEDLHGSIVERLPRDKRSIAALFLRVDYLELNVHRSAAGYWTLEQRRPGEHLRTDSETDGARLNTDIAVFSKAVLQELARLQEAGTHVELRGLDQLLDR